MLLLLRSYKIIYNYRKKIQVKLERRKYPSCFSCRLPAWIYIYIYIGRERERKRANQQSDVRKRRPNPSFDVRKERNRSHADRESYL